MFTAMFAAYDQILEHTPQTVDCDFIVFTDDVAAIPGQFRVFFADTPGGHTLPGLKNAWMRLYPFDIPELNEYDIVIYIDANVRIVDPSFIEHILDRCESAGPFDMMLSVHPWNVCLYEEARDSRTMAKYVNTDLEGQVDFYRREGFPAFAGLYWNGFIVYNRSCDRARVAEFQSLYWREITAYSKTPDAHMQGQVSLPYCLWKTNLNVVKIPQLYRSRELEIRPHLR